MVDPVSPAPPQLACRVRPSTVASAIQTQAEFDVRAASSAIARTPAQIEHHAPRRGVDPLCPQRADAFRPYRWQAMRRVGQERSCDAAHRVLVPLLGQILDR
jgi:hypothetical protein